MRVKVLKMNTPKRYRGECEGAWKCAARARMSMIRVNNAAIGCTIRIADSVVRVLEGRSKLDVWASLKRLAVSKNREG